MKLIVLFLIVIQFLLVYGTDETKNNELINQILVQQIAKLGNTDIQNVEKLLPHLTHQDIENIKYISRLNISTIVRKMAYVDYEDILLGILAGVGKSLNPNVNECIDSIRGTIHNSNIVYYDFFHLYDISIRELFNFFGIFPTVVKENYNVYSVCSLEKLQKKLYDYLRIIREEGISAFIGYQRDIFYQNPFTLLTITRGLIDSLVEKDYGMFGYHVGEYLGVLLKQ